MSIHLFPQVDVIFDNDVGFLSAIKTFMATTKRPVVLTTNGKHTHSRVVLSRKDLKSNPDPTSMSVLDPSFRERFSCGLEEITFKDPSEVDFYLKHPLELFKQILI